MASYSTLVLDLISYYKLNIISPESWKFIIYKNDKDEEDRIMYVIGCVRDGSSVWEVLLDGINELSISPGNIIYEARQEKLRENK